MISSVSSSIEMTTLAAAPTAAAAAADPSSDEEDRAAVHAQRVVRGFLGRLAAVRQANLIYEKIFDPRTHGYYYYNTKTFETTWNVRGYYASQIDVCTLMRSRSVLGVVYVGFTCDV